MRKTLLISLLFVSIQVSAQNTSKSYIEKFKDDAVRIMHQSGIPASIILAIAMHESGNGNSEIAKNLNNQFGMKGYSPIVYIKRRKKVRTMYKQYECESDSFADFARIMTEKKKFVGLASQFTHYDYAGWVHGIQRAGYASSRKWASQVIALIKKYQLNSFDENPNTQPKTELAQGEIQ